MLVFVRLNYPVCFFKSLAVKPKCIFNCGKWNIYGCWDSSLVEFGLCAHIDQGIGLCLSQAYVGTENTIA
ncbi:hypothetical protein AX774_g454 [Zancudomyces culisetae]|uniref:Uncharacterized protein n=1 Tax=Zancudomyces culisetae TaxID=1213189 RepID=A0A1R1PYG0_ZANCU|nr:hypothetical protein AX774_g454 [Zancudomyces culisetae]|eukprot:OMH85990.1 hypothetical protein AX774_g454 [Zancudomyces culisetae]